MDRLLTRSGLAAALPVFLVGCTATFNTALVEVPQDQVPQLSASEPIAVINDQPPLAPSEFFAAGGVRWMTDFSVWTETAVAAMRAALSSRGVPTPMEADRQLKLRITGGEVIVFPYVKNCMTFLIVETGAGDRWAFEGLATSSRGWKKACNVAVSRAVARALGDSGVREYLRNGTVAMPSDPSVSTPNAGIEDLQ